MKSTVGLYLSVKEASDKLGLFTVKERDWLLGKVNMSKPYEYRLRLG